MPITITYDEKSILLLLDDLFYWKTEPGHIWMST